MSRITNCFKQLQNRKALITFITAGDPTPDATLPLLHDLVESGADILEIGIPFSDPMAEGPVIQAACERALAQGMTLIKLFEIVKAFRKENQTTPIVLMGYLNPIEIIGYKKFAKLAAESGVDGLIIVDLPSEEAYELDKELKQHNINLIYLIAPTTPPARIKKIAEQASGFLYYVSLKGVTGAGHLDTEAVQQKVSEIRQVTSLPIAIGFGIRDAESAKAMAAIGDGIVIGSAIVKHFEQGGPIDQMRQKVKEFLGKIRSVLF